jgi:hypothetical protein
MSTECTMASARHLHCSSDDFVHVGHFGILKNSGTAYRGKFCVTVRLKSHTDIPELLLPLLKNVTITCN